MKKLLFVLLFIPITNLAQSKPDGPYKDYFDSGELMLEGQYKNKKKVGEWKRYFKSGQVYLIYSYTDGKKDIPETSFFKDGSVKRKIENKGKEYFVFGYYETGELFYEKQYKSGYYKEYREDGSLKIESNYYDFQLNGKWKRFDEDENLEWSVGYENGYRNGIYKQFYKNGKLKLEGVILRERKNGEEKRYDKSGNVLWMGKYKDDMFSKTWIQYNASGKKVRKINSKKEDIPFNPTVVPDGLIERVPVYPGCEEFYGNRARKKCMSENIVRLVNKSFNTDLALDLDLKGKQRILVSFKIDKTGNVVSVMARAPHPELENEAKRVIRLIPNTEPGYQRGKPVVVPFSLPIIFQVQ